MRILAVSVKYPTLLQTWFINYLKSIESLGVDVSVASLFKGHVNYHPETDRLRLGSTWSAKGSFATDFTRAFTYFLKNFYRASTYSYFLCAFKYTTSTKEAARALLFVDGITDMPTIIHCHSEKAAISLLPLIKFFRVPLTLTFHGLPPEGVPDITNEKRNFLYSFVDRVFVNTKFAKEQFLSLTKFRNKIDIVPQGIDISVFPFNPASYDKDSPIILLTVGRLDRLKGHDFAIEAVRLLKERGVNVEYWIVGDGLYKNELQMKINETGLSVTVKILGSKTGDDLTSIYQSAHIFVLPSIEEPGAWAETQGIVIQEAQACGLLTIATRTGGIPECIVNNETGFLVESKDPTAIANKVRYLLDNQERWDFWRLKARKHVEEHFDYRDMGKRLVASYEEILSNY